MSQDPQFVTIKEAAHRAQVSRRTVERWIRAGHIRGVRVVPAARQVLIPVRDIDPRARLARRDA